MNEPLNQQQIRELFASHPQAEAVDPDTGEVFYGSQLREDHYVRGADVRDMHEGRPQEAPGAVHVSHVVRRWHVGLPIHGV